MQERRIGDFWGFGGSRGLSVPWTGFTQFTLFSEQPPDRYMVREETDKAASDIQAQNSGEEWQGMLS